MARQAIVKDEQGNEVATINIPEGATQDQIMEKVEAVKAEAVRRKQEQPQPQAATQEVAPEQQSFINALGDNAEFLAKTFGANVAAGLGGLAELARTRDPEQANQFIDYIKGSLEPETPQSEQAQQQLNTVGEVVETAMLGPRFLTGTVADVANVATGGEPFAVTKSVMEQGAGEAAGDAVLESTGSPLLATLAFSTPTVIMEAYGLKGGSTIAKGVPDIPQSKTKRKIGELLQEGEIDTRTAGWKLEGGLQKSEPELIETAPEKFTETMRVGAPRVVKFKPARNALSQGWSEDVVAIASGVNAPTRSKLKQMVEIQDNIRTKPLEKRKQRASDVAGDSVLERFEYVRNVNKESGQRLNEVAKNLQGNDVNLDASFSRFFNDLGDELGVYINESMTPNYAGSIIEDSAGNKDVINTVLRRLSRLEKSPDALQVHNLKKYIDEQVTYGKTRSDKPLTQKTENVLKDLRRDIDGVLDEQFPEYNEVNTIYSETVNALDNMQGALGKKIDLTADNANQAAGTTLRSLMSNNRGRTELSNTINELDKVAKRYGADFQDDIFAQVVFADELERVFGTAAKTSLKGDVETAIKTSIPKVDKNIISRGFEKAGEKIKELRFNEDKAIESMNNLLSE